jgi:hypothetical protein
LSEPTDQIAIVDLADDLQVRKQRIFKILARLGIRSSQRRDSNRGNQNVATITLADAAVVRAEIEKGSAASTSAEPRAGWAAVSYSDDVGFFYLIELEPEHDRGRFKVGFTMDLDGRLQKHRCSAPFAKYVQTWFCRRAWERAAIDCATQGCERIHTEVFRAVSLGDVTDRVESFFKVMPNVREDVAGTGETDSEAASAG